MASSVLCGCGCCYYEKLRRTIRTAIVSHLFKKVKSPFSIFLNNFSEYNIFSISTLNEVKCFKETRGWTSVSKSRVEIKGQLSIYNGAFLQEQLTTFSYFCKKLLYIDVWLGSKYRSDKNETFKMKVRFAKSLRLLQSASFLINSVFKEESFFLYCNYKKLLLRKSKSSPHETANWFTFTIKVYTRKLHFLCSTPTI